VCILVGVVCSEAQVHASAQRAISTKIVQNPGEATSLSMVRSSRRSFIKWGVQLGIVAIVGTGYYLNRTLDVFAADTSIAPCPGNEDCDCGPGGSVGWSGDCEVTFNCTGHEGQEVPEYTFCTVYCCGSGNACEYYRWQSGWVQCQGGC
jgi:hypothetical protein